MKDEQAAFSVVVPLAPQHDHLVASFIDQLQSDWGLIRELIVVRSRLTGTSAARRRARLITAVDRFPLPVRLIDSPAGSWAGTNRNIGWQAAHAEFVAFMDADDLYHPQRLAVTLSVLRSTQADAMIHDYSRIEGSLGFPVVDWGVPVSILTADEIRSANSGNRVREHELAGRASTRLELPYRASGKSRNLHHGHLTVRTSLRGNYLFEAIPSGEDGLLLRDFIYGGVNLVWADLLLSVHDWRLSAYRARKWGPFMERLQRFKASRRHAQQY